MRTKLTSILLAVSSCAILFGSCKKETENLEGLENGYNFMPLQVGKYIVYDVDSTVWDDFLKTEVHNNYQMRYDVVDSFNDNQNRLTYTINVQQRKESMGTYIPRDVIHVTKTGTTLEHVQGNIRTIKMTFPVRDGNTWNGNVFLPTDNPNIEEYNNYTWNYNFSNYMKMYDPGNNPYQSTVTVNQIDDAVNEPDGDDYASKNFGQEIYAYNVGMIQRERIYWVYQPNVGYRKGYAVTMRAIENN